MPPIESGFPTKKGYHDRCHHGDLRAALIGATDKLMANHQWPDA
jgi:hypothetical protein